MKILVVKLSSMGDVLHALPTVAELKRQTGAEIHWAVHPAFAALVRCFACVDGVVEIPRKGTILERWGAIRRLRRERYDWVVDLQGLLKSALVAGCAKRVRGGRLVGPGFSREGAGWIYEAVPKLAMPRRHAVEECLEVLTVLGLEKPEVVRFPLEPPVVDVGPDGVFRVAIAPASRWVTKNWPIENFAKVVKLLKVARGDGVEIHVLGGGADRVLGEEVERLSGVRVVNHCGQLDIPHSCGVLRRVDCLLTNDSGPMHLAAAVGTRCVAIFGPTEPSRTGPYGAEHRVLQTNVCPPCHRRECGRKDHACMCSVTPESALKAILRGV